MKTYQIKDFTILGMFTKEEAVKELTKAGMNYFKALSHVNRWLA